jgi:stalled ribosome alternative rescue factor ArfA
MSRNVPAERLRDKRYRQQVVKPKRGKGSFSRDKRVIVDDADDAENDECHEDQETLRPASGT